MPAITFRSDSGRLVARISPVPMSGPAITTTAALAIVSDATFSTDVLQSDKTVLVDFWAEWCGPCKMVAPVLDEIAGENKDTLTVAKLDIDRNPDAMRKYKIMAVPTLMVFQKGEVVKEIRGAKPKAALLRDLADYLG